MTNGPAPGTLFEQPPAPVDVPVGHTGAHDLDADPVARYQTDTTFDAMTAGYDRDAVDPMVQVNFAHAVEDMEAVGPKTSLEELQRAIGALLKYTGQRIGDKKLEQDAETIFGFTGYTIDDYLRDEDERSREKAKNRK